MTTFTGPEHNEIVASGLLDGDGDLYLITVRGQWPIYAVKGEKSAISAAHRLETES